MHPATLRTAASGRRARWWTELPLIALVYLAYSAGRLLARGDVASATDNALAILRAEDLLRLAPERPLNALFTAVPALGVPADFVYASLHYLVTPAVLVWLWRRRPHHYRVLRTWLMLATLIGLIGFTLLPTAPPRLLPEAHGFVDTMAHYSSYGWWGQEASAPRGMGGMTNQYAAMPSLHVGWALWCGAALWRHGTARATRAFAVAYPLVTLLVVMGTANHYFLDAVAGAAVMGVGLLLARPALRLADGVRGRTGTGRLREGAGRVRTPHGKARGQVPFDGAVARGAHAVAVDVSAGCETSARTAMSRATLTGSPAAVADRRGGPGPQREADPEADRRERTLLPRQSARGRTTAAAGPDDRAAGAPR